jgi:ATP-dependent DNA helicase RecQ
MPKRVEESRETLLKKQGGAGSATGAEAGAGGGPVSGELFQKLRELRRELADEAGVPAFVVFADAALRDMCRHMPVTEAEFLEVSGVGEQKLARYGAAFIAAVKAFQNAK